MKLRGLKIMTSSTITVDLIDKSYIEPGSIIIQEIETGGRVIYEKPKDYS